MASDPTATLLVDGSWRSGTKTFDVVDPATLEVIGAVADGAPEDARAALDAACAAFDGWRKTTAEERAGHLRAAATEFRNRAEELAALLTAENGKPVAEARGEIIGSARMLEWSAEEGRRANGRVTPAAGGPGLVLMSPVGPALAISPWNFPASMLIRKIGLALAAGAPMIAKPAEQTPMIATELIRILNDTGLPAGVLQSITTTRPAEVVGALLGDPRLRKVSFTGSTEVGLSLLRNVHGHLRRTSLELGGHSPAIVYGDADLPRVADALTTAKFANAGQSCIAVNRLLVESDVHDELVGLLVERAAALKVGRGSDEGVRVGPLIDGDGLAKVRRHVDDALAKGAKAVVGGDVWAPDDPTLKGAFFQPTILTGVDRRMSVTQEETFGPVLAVLPFASADEAIAEANDTAYGLAAYLFGSDIGRIWDTVERLDFGIIGVNDATPVRPELPFGGVKNSGQEREGGSEGLDAYLEPKAVSVRI